jgi:hypothetical protein
LQSIGRLFLPGKKEWLIVAACQISLVGNLTGIRKIKMMKSKKMDKGERI